MPALTGNPSLTQLTVGVGDMAVSKSVNDFIITYALGSCIGVTAWDPNVHVGGMLHYMLPDSHLNPEKAKEKPAMFGDTGLALFLNQLFQMGATKRGLVIRLAGGANVLSDGQFFDIGKRNLLMAKRLLWKNALVIKSEDCEGNISRTLTLEMSSGRATIRNGGTEREL
jgi:chemotaxis protein CheD